MEVIGSRRSYYYVLVLLGVILFSTLALVTHNVALWRLDVSTSAGKDEVVKQHLWRLIEGRSKERGNTDEINQRSSEQATIVIAHCVFPQAMRSGEPVIGAEYMAKVLGPLIFPDKLIKLVTCLAVPEQLPKGTDPSSEEGLRQLGLLNVHLRFCAYGSSSVIKGAYGKLAAARPDRIGMGSLVVPKAIREGSVDGLTSPRRNTINVYVSRATGNVIGPLITRTNRESWFESVPGVAVQFDTKLSPVATDSFTIYMPYAYESFGRSRWNGGDSSRKIARHDESFGKNDMFYLRESVTRQQGFDAKKERESKEFFMAMVNSNCRDSMRTTMIRGLFGYAVHELLGKPVHNLGACPLGDDGALRAGITVQQRAAFAKRWPVGKGSPTSAQEIFSHHKFAICFENADVDGYMTEKIVTPYIARSIPVYWGGGDALKKVFNPRAFVHCDLPRNVSSLLKDGLPEFTREVCGKQTRTKYECDRVLEDEFYRISLPYFKPCIEQIRMLDEDDEAYERMLSEPLATVNDNSELTGYWNETRYAVAVRAAFDALGYTHGPRELRQALDLASTT